MKNEHLLHCLSVEEENEVFELKDRIWVQYVSFESFIQNHNGTQLVPGLKQELDQISKRMHGIHERLVDAIETSPPNDDDDTG